MAKTKKKASPVQLSFTERILQPHVQRYVIAAMAVLLYISSVTFSYNLDDELVTMQHRLTSRGISAIPDIISSPYYSDDMGYSYDYRPLVLITFAIEHSLFGDNPGVSHLINTLLYGVVCLVVFLWFQMMFKSKGALFPFVAALLFVVHPAHTEVVSSIKNRDELLGLLLAVLAAMAALKVSQKYGWLYLLAVPVTFFIAMLGKTTMAPFAVIIPVSMVLLTDTRLLLAQLLFLLLFSVVVLFASAKQTWIVVSLAALGVIGLWILYNTRHGRWMQLIHQIAQKVKSAANALWNLFKPAQELDKAPLPTPSHNRPLLFSIKNLFWLFWYELALVAIAGGYILHNPIVTFVGAVLLVVIHTRLDDRFLLPGMFIFTALHFISFYTISQVNSNTYMPLVLCSILLFIYGGGKWNKIGTVLILLALAVKDIFYTGNFLWLFIVPFTGLYNKSFIRLTWVGFASYAVIAAWKWYEYFNGIYIDPLMYINPLLIGVFIYLRKTGNWKPVFYVSLLVLFGFQFYCGYQIHGIKPLPTVNTKNFTSSARITMNNAATAQTRPVVQGSTDRPLDFVETPIDFHAPLKDRIGTASVVMGRYMKNLLIPYPLAFYYGYAVVTGTPWTAPESLVSMLLVIILLAISIILAPRYGSVTMGLIIIVVPLLFFSGLFEPIAGMMADRYLLIPSIGFCILLAGLFIALRPARLTMYNSVFIVFIFAYSTITIFRNAKWKDSLTLMRNDIAYVSKSAQAHNLLAIRLVKTSFDSKDVTEQRSMRLEALGHFKQAQAIYPRFFNVAFDIGRVYVLLNMPDSALAAFQNAIAIDSTYSESHLQVGEILFQLKKYPEAIPYFKYVIKARPLDYIGYDKLSYLYFSMKLYELSIAVNRQATVNIPGIIDPYVNMGRVYLSMNNNDSALYYLHLADSLLPGNQQVQNLIQSTNAGRISP
jgi:hypothetical protein